MLADIVMVIEKIGIPAAVIVALFWGFWKLAAQHKEERVEWREDSKVLHEKSNEVFSKSTEAIRNLTNVISSSRD